MSDNEIEKIEPVDFDISKSPLFSAEPVQPVSNKPSPWVWIGLGLLAVVALAVIFVLPAVVTEYQLPLERRPDIVELSPSSTSTARAPINAVSPFDEAQRSLQRKEAQDALAKLLELQADLASRDVEAWAKQDYDNALEFARVGDEAYLQQSFIDARDNYIEGADSLQRLLDTVPTVLSRNLIDAEAALATNQSAQALEKFSIALILDPDNSQASIGLGRAETLDEVNRLLDEAAKLEQSGELESARGLYLAARDLDDRNETSQQFLEQIERKILENEFAQIMSEGFALFQADQPEQAIAEFERAASLGINQGQAMSAIQQTRDEVARLEIERLDSVATSAQAGEKWQEAVAAYNDVLAIDANIIFAQEGKDYTEKRLRLDQLLETAIANPERFAEDAVYQQTVDVYYTGRSIENAGPRLEQQLNQLQVLLDNSQVPVTISFVSDNLTRVTLLRVGELGEFESQTRELKPGRYVAVGTRNGYRDVREEFVVGFGQTPESVVVKCDERIVATRGR